MFENHSHMSDDNNTKNTVLDLDASVPVTEPIEVLSKKKSKPPETIEQKIEVPVIDEYTVGIDPVRAKRLAERREASLKKGVSESANPQSPVKVIYVPGPAVPSNLACHFGHEGSGVTLFPLTPTLVSAKDAEYLHKNFPRRIFLSDPDGKPIPFPVNKEGASK